jgi:hypothetical protein
MTSLNNGDPAGPGSSDDLTGPLEKLFEIARVEVFT